MVMPAAGAETNSKPQGEHRAVIWTRGGPEAMRAGLPESQFRVIDSEQDREQDAKERMINVFTRNAIFNKVGLTETVAHMDEFAKDVLVLDAQGMSLAQLKGAYPQMRPENLRQLQKELKSLRADPS